LISLSSVADGGEGRGEEALLKNPLSLALSPRSAGGAREWLPSRKDNLFYKATFWSAGWRDIPVPCFVRPEVAIGKPPESRSAGPESLRYGITLNAPKGGLEPFEK